MTSKGSLRTMGSQKPQGTRLLYQKVISNAFLFVWKFQDALKFVYFKSKKIYSHFFQRTKAKDMDMVNMDTRCFIWSLIGSSCHLSLHYGYSYLRWQKLVRINELIDPNKYMMYLVFKRWGLRKHCFDYEQTLTYFSYNVKIMIFW